VLKPHCQAFLVLVKYSVHVRKRQGRLRQFPDFSGIEMLEDSMHAAKRAAVLSKELLTFAKGGDPVKRIFNIVDLIQDSTRFALRGSNVSCIFDIPDTGYAVDADADQIGQVINNLVINAKRVFFATFFDPECRKFIRDHAHLPPTQIFGP